MSWSTLEREVTAGLARRLRTSLSRESRGQSTECRVVAIDVLRVSVPQEATPEQIAERVCDGVLWRVHHGGDR